MKIEMDDYCDRLPSVEHEGIRYYQSPSFPRYWMSREGEIIFNKKNRSGVESDEFSKMSLRRQVSETSNGLIRTKPWWTVYGEIFIENPEGKLSVRRLIRASPVRPEQFEWYGEKPSLPSRPKACAIAQMVAVLG